MSNLLTAPQVGAKLGVSAFHVHRLAKRGQLPYLKAGRFFLFEPKAVEGMRKRRAAQRARRGRE